MSSRIEADNKSPTVADVRAAAQSFEERMCSVGTPRGPQGIVERVYRARRGNISIRARVIMDSGAVCHVDIADVYCF